MLHESMTCWCVSAKLSRNSAEGPRLQASRCTRCSSLRFIVRCDPTPGLPSSAKHTANGLATLPVLGRYPRVNHAEKRGREAGDGSAPPLITWRVPPHELLKKGRGDSIFL